MTGSRLRDFFFGFFFFLFYFSAFCLRRAEVMRLVLLKIHHWQMPVDDVVDKPMYRRRWLDFFLILVPFACVLVVKLVRCDVMCVCVCVRERTLNVQWYSNGNVKMLSVYCVAVENWRWDAIYAAPASRQTTHCSTFPCSNFVNEKWNAGNSFDQILLRIYILRS